MNHEASGNIESTVPSDNKWDSIGDEVPFNENTELEVEEKDIAEFVEQFYGDKLDLIVGKTCYDGDGSDTDNPDAYVVAFALEKVFTNDEQLEIIDTIAKGGYLNDDQRNRVKTGIADMIMKSGMAEDIAEDPYLRSQHIDELSGRYDPKLTDNERHLQILLWNADMGFETSREAYDMLADKDFLERRYRVSEIVERNKPYNPELSEEDMAAYYSESIANSLQHMVSNGDKTIKDILSDPFCRKDHFENMYDMEIFGKTPNPDFDPIWEVDSEYTTSYEYGSMLFEYAKKNPDIYEKVDDKEINQVISEVLEKISEKEIMNIIKAYEKNPRKGDEMMMKTLLPILGLDKNPPALTYGKAKDKEGGFYKRSEHRVNICEENIDSRESTPEEDRILTTSAIRNIFKPKKLEDAMFYRMGAVAHEFWHAHQWAGEGVSDERREKYRKNFVYYMSGRSYYGAYRSQLIEAEAWKFGTKMEEKCHDAYNKLRGNNG